jgi:hypothetical protein
VAAGAFGFFTLIQVFDGPEAAWNYARDTWGAYSQIESDCEAIVLCQKILYREHKKMRSMSVSTLTFKIVGFKLPNAEC